jgi:hypothetical protein
MRLLEGKSSVNAIKAAGRWKPDEGVIKNRRKENGILGRY